MNFIKNMFKNKLIIMAFVSFIIGIIYFALYNTSFFSEFYLTYFNYKPSWFWNTLPLVIINIIIALYMQNSFKEGFKLFLTGAFCSIFTMYIVLITYIMFSTQ